MVAEQIGQSVKLPWLPPSASFTLYSTTTDIPPLELVTSVHCFCFAEDRCLFVNHNSRGWDIPGGHIEGRETASEALKREMLEEAGIDLGSERLFAYSNIHIPPPYHGTSRYPVPDSYQLFFVSADFILQEFAAEFETSERAFISTDSEIVREWSERNALLLEAAVQANKSADM